MSDKKIRVWSWRNAISKSKAPPLTKAVCHALSIYVSDVGAGCWPGTKTLLQDTGLSNKALSKHLHLAVEHGLLMIRRTKGSDGTYGYNIYYPRFPKNMVLPEPNDDSSDPENVSQNGDPPSVPDTLGPSVPPSPDQVYFSPDPSVPRTHKLSNELSNEPPKRARKRAGGAAKPQSKKVKGNEPMALTPSPEALEEGHALAGGWDRDELLAEFREWDRDGEPVRNVDAAWIGFCRHRGANPDHKERQFKSSVPEAELKKRDQMEPGIVRRGDAGWEFWLDDLRARGAGKLAEQIEWAGAMDAPCRFPMPTCKTLPKPIARKRVAA